MNWSTGNKLGLVLLGVAAMSNFVPPPAPQDGVMGPPLPVIIAGAVLGIITLVGIVVAWREGSRKAALVAITASTINVLLALPAFFVSGVPQWVQVFAGACIGVTVVGIALTLIRSKEA